MEKFIEEYQHILGHAPHGAVISGMVRLAEGAADEGDEELALMVWDTVIKDLTDRGEWMRLSILVGNGNKMIGIAADSEAADGYVKKALGVAA